MIKGKLLSDYLSIRKLLLPLLIILVVYSPASSFALIAKHTVGKVWYSNDKVYIYINPAYPGGSPKFKYNSTTGNRFYVDILNSKISTNLNAVINLDDVKNLRRAQNNPSTSRVVIQFNKSGIKPKVRFVNGSNPYILVSWNGTSRSSTGKTNNRFKILIDPGHGGVHPGSVGPIKKLIEKDVTLDIAKMLKQLLADNPDVEVRMTRTTDRHLNANLNLDLAQRKNIAREWKPDIFISIHVNGNRDKNLNQTEVYYYDRKSIALAKAVRDNLITRLNRNAGEVRRRNFKVIQNNPATYGSVLVESCYISSVRGEKLLSQKNYRRAIAEGLRNSIDAFMSSAAVTNNN